MSEPKPIEELLTKYDKRIEFLEKNLQILKEPSKSQESHTDSKPPHAHSANVQFECPGCKEEYDSKVKTKVLSDLKEKAVGSHHCKTCGLKVEEEEESCPLCGGTDAE